MSCCSLSVEDLMHLACSSIVCGGGTNQELALHCLYESNGDIMVSAKKRPDGATRLPLCAMDGCEGEGVKEDSRGGSHSPGSFPPLLDSRCHYLLLLCAKCFFFPRRAPLDATAAAFFHLSIRRDGIAPTQLALDCSECQTVGI